MGTQGRRHDGVRGQLSEKDEQAEEVRITPEGRHEAVRANYVVNFESLVRYTIIGRLR